MIPVCDVHHMASITMLKPGSRCPACVAEEQTKRLLAALSTLIRATDAWDDASEDDCPLEEAEAAEKRYRSALKDARDTIATPHTRTMVITEDEVLTLWVRLTIGTHTAHGVKVFNVFIDRLKAFLK